VLHDIALALRRLPALVRSQVTVVFVTADPARDTGVGIRRWLDDIDPSFIGLTGPAAAIARAESAVGVPHAVREPGKGSDYAVDHYSGVIAYGRNDRVAVKYPSNAVVGDYTADLPLLIGEEPSR
jgi:protein SCO1/2